MANLATTSVNYSASAHADNAFLSSSLYGHLSALLSIASITPNDLGCQHYLKEQLTALGFSCQQFHCHGVSNLIAKIGTGCTRIAFAGHTDVVPPGDETLWQNPPFTPTITGGKLFARGVADMKGGIAAMLSAFEEVLPQLDLTKYQFYFLITSDEEGEAIHGTQEIVDRLARQNQLPHYCIVGEPSASAKTGDAVKVGRRGAISGEISIKGKQGHVAYPQYAQNAAHLAAKFAYYLSELEWDSGSTDFPGSSLQITAIETGQWTDNVIPGQSKVCFNVRYSHKHTMQQVMQRIEMCLSEKLTPELSMAIDWQRPCEPYFTNKQSGGTLSLISKAEQAIFQTCHLYPRLSTSGGTSDGRFIASAGCQVIELGVPNATIHQINEHVKISDLVTLEKIYKKLLVNLMES